MKKPVIAIAGLGCENSTFTPSRTRVPAFHPQRGEDILNLDRNKFLWKGAELRNAAEWHGILTGHAMPGGRVTTEAFEELAGEIVSGLAALTKSTKLDGLWFDIHGAMYVEGFEDAEFELLSRIRKAIGSDVVVSASMDLHGNVSRELAHQTDLITCYRTAPHVDVAETRERACRNLVDSLAKSTGNSKPTLPIKAWIPLPILLPGEQTSTRDEPAEHIYAAVPEVEAMDGVLDAAIWVGYAWGDERRNRAIVMATGADVSAVSKGAEKLAKLFWDSHADFKFVAPTGTFDECFDTALASKVRPYYISDSGDNPTAGGSGDVTWTLTQILGRQEKMPHHERPSIIYASMPGPEAIQIATEAGIGATVTVTAGAEVDNLHSGPIELTGRVHSIRHGDIHAQTEVVLQVGNVFVILTKLRKPFHKEHDFTRLNLDPRNGVDIVVVKIGYLEPELYDMAKDWMLALTPGGVDQDLERLGHNRIRRPMWPFDKHFDLPPNLTARIIAPSHEPLTGPDE